jgi:hypothetical protein
MEDENMGNEGNEEIPSGEENAPAENENPQESFAKYKNKPLLLENKKIKMGNKNKENVFNAFDLLIEGVKTNFGSKSIESETKPFKIIDENFRINEEIESMITRLENDDFLNEETDINIDK